jgi:hypothetical protein
VIAIIPFPFLEVSKNLPTISAPALFLAIPTLFLRFDVWSDDLSMKFILRKSDILSLHENQISFRL